MHGDAKTTPACMDRETAVSGHISHGKIISEQQCTEGIALVLLNEHEDLLHLAGAKTNWREGERDA